MFDRCRTWRQRILRRAEGTLPSAEWGALDSHLTVCARCRAYEEADDALHSIRRLCTPLSHPVAEAFDARVLAELRIPAHAGGRLRLVSWIQALSARWETLPKGFLMQIAGGALLAASVTAFCLTSALRPAGPITGRSAEDRAALVMQRNEPPVPLETLLEHASPRAALLWNVPGMALDSEGDVVSPSGEDDAGKPPR